MTTRQEFAAAILGMSYGTLKEICADLAATIEDKEARPKLETAEEFADLLFDWADAQDAG